MGQAGSGGDITRYDSMSECVCESVTVSVSVSVLSVSGIVFVSKRHPRAEGCHKLVDLGATAAAATVAITAAIAAGDTTAAAVAHTITNAIATATVAAVAITTAITVDTNPDPDTAFCAAVDGHYGLFQQGRDHVRVLQAVQGEVEEGGHVAEGDCGHLWRWSEGWR